MPFGVPRPVGPSKPATAVQRYCTEQEPFEPPTTSLSAVVWLYG